MKCMECTWNIQKTWLDKTILKKKKGGGLRLPDFGVYSKAQESCGAGTKPVTDQWNRRKTDNNLDTHSVDF